MALDNNKLTIFTDVMDTKLQEASVVPSIARGVYRGQVVRGGTVKILGSEDVVIGQYAGTIVHQSMAGTEQDVAIQNKPYFSIKLGFDDLSQVPTNEVSFLTGKAGKSLALDVDQKLVALNAKAVTSITGVIANIDNMFTGLATAFDLANVGMNDRAVILSPASANELIAIQGDKLQGEKASDIVYNGYLGKYMGIEIYKSNQIAYTGTVAHGIGVDMSALVLARSYEEVDQVKGVDFFGAALRGLLVYGVDIVETQTGASDRIIAFDVDEA